MSAPTTLTATVTSADGTQLAVESIGHGPALVCVDGALCFRDAGPLRSLARLLAERFTVHLYDRRGRGVSTDTAPYAVEREVEDLAAVIDHAGGRASVYGASSGALLAVRAAAAGVPIERLALFEPPLRGETDSSASSSLTAELTGLIADDRRSDAVQAFLTSIGVPGEVVSGMRSSPAWAVLESIAPTLVYDAIISDTTTRAHLGAVPVPTLVLDSAGSSGDLTGWSADAVAALPSAVGRSLPGQWHQVADDVLAPVLIEHLAG